MSNSAGSCCGKKENTQMFQTRSQNTVDTDLGKMIERLLTRCMEAVIEMEHEFFKLENEKDKLDFDRVDFERCFERDPYKLAFEMQQRMEMQQRRQKIKDASGEPEI